MAFNPKDRVAETTQTTGTGAYDLDGVAPGFGALNTIVGAHGDGNSGWFVAYDANDYEIFRGTVTAGSPDTLSRDTIIESTNSDAAVNWGAGVKTILEVIPAADLDSDNFRALIKSKEVLTADRTYYVRTDGDDDNDGLVDSAAGAKATLQGALDAAAALEQSGYTVTIQFGSGTHSVFVDVDGYIFTGPIKAYGDSGDLTAVVWSGDSRFINAIILIEIAYIELQTSGLWGEGPNVHIESHHLRYILQGNFASFISCFSGAKVNYQLQSFQSGVFFSSDLYIDLNGHTFSSLFEGDTTKFCTIDINDLTISGSFSWLHAPVRCFGGGASVQLQVRGSVSGGTITGTLMKIGYLDDVNIISGTEAKVSDSPPALSNPLNNASSGSTNFGATNWTVDADGNLLVPSVQQNEVVAVVADTTPGALTFSAALNVVSNTTDGDDVADLPTNVAADVGKEIPVYASDAFTLESADASATIDGVASVPIPAGTFFKARLVADNTWKLFKPKEVLTADRTYYVRTDGDDDNTGLVDSAAGAKATLQGALDAIIELDQNGFTAKVQFGDGSHDPSVDVDGYIFSGVVQIVGNSGDLTAVVLTDVIRMTNCVGIFDIGYFQVEGYDGFYADGPDVQMFVFSIRWIALGPYSSLLLTNNGGRISYHDRLSDSGSTNTPLYIDATGAGDQVAALLFSTSASHVRCSVLISSVTLADNISWYWGAVNAINTQMQLFLTGSVSGGTISGRWGRFGSFVAMSSNSAFRNNMGSEDAAFTSPFVAGTGIAGGNWSITQAGHTVVPSIQQNSVADVVADTTPGTLTFDAALNNVTNTNDADDHVDLPTNVADDVGKTIRVRAEDAFELRTADASATINGVTAGDTNEAAVSAGDYLECECIADNTWLVKRWTSAGAFSTLTPDSV